MQEESEQRYRKTIQYKTQGENVGVISNQQSFFDSIVTYQIGRK